MASKKRSSKKTAKKRTAKKRSSKAKRGSSPLARMAASKGMTIAQLRVAVPACGKWSVRRVKSTRKRPCR
jgi:hypothetical protein